ncbi:hypothetical protein SDC9_118856 [bioreactor metagenome]|uniref:Uncharacterized protein n=1 Tax=bioreactor metagenome TaxID=1076179 RepID=A0A645C2X7_9ZZZZ
MTKTERSRLIKFTIAAYISFLAIPVFGFKTTTSIAFSAIFVITYGSTRRGCLEYSVNRMLAQVVGVAIGTALYFTFQTFTFLPSYQRVALSMTLGLVLSLYVKYRFHLPIAEFTMFTPPFLVLLMTPGNSYYPLLRLAYCSIGVVIGILVNFFVYPADHGKETQGLLEREENLLRQLMGPFSQELALPPEEAKVMKELDLLESQITLAATEWKSDITHHKRRTKEGPDYERVMARHRLNQACWKMMKQADGLSLQDHGAFRAQCAAILRSVFAVHTQAEAAENHALDAEALLTAQPATQEGCLMTAAVIGYLRLLPAAAEPAGV